MKHSRFWVGFGMISATLGLGSLLYSAPSYAAEAAGVGASGGAMSNPGTGSSLINLGVLGGIGFVSSNGGTQLVIGANGDYKLMPQISVGAYFTYNPLTAPANSSNSLLTLAAEANYHVVGILEGVRLGGKVGAGWVRSSVSGGDSDTTGGLAIGPHAAYDYPVGGGLTLGGEANMIFYTQRGGFSSVNLLANVKYWF